MSIQVKVMMTLRSIETIFGAFKFRYIKALALILVLKLVYYLS